MKNVIFLLSAVLPGVLAMPITVNAEAPSGYGAVFRWYVSAAEAGDPEAQFMLALQYEQGLRFSQPPDLPKAEEWYRRSAENGYALAMFRLALLLQQQDGAAARSEAVQWLTQAAESGLADAQFNLAIALESGAGVPVDEAGAIRWYRAAAEQGMPAAMYNLGGLLATGDTAPLDDVEAYRWLDQAAAAGIAEAAGLRDRLAERMTPAMIEEARAASVVNP